MAFTVTLYTCSADRRVVDKSSYLTPINNGTNVVCRPTDGVDMLAPTFILDYKENYLLANYLYCSTFGGRYYYVEDREIEIGKKIVLHCKVDPLYTWKNEFINCNGTITRSESIGGPTYVPDSKFPVDPNRREQLLVQTPFNPAAYYGEGNTNRMYYVRMKGDSSQSVIWPTPPQPITP